jgi:hypothetical protein
MIGGKVIETIDCREWLSTEQRFLRSTCAIYVERDAKARTVAEGDSVWWQGGFAMWTPANFHPNGRSGIDFDIKLRKIGYSGVARPTSKNRCEGDGCNGCQHCIADDNSSSDIVTRKASHEQRD